MPKKKTPYGSALREARDAAGLTQQELADTLGCHVVFVSGMERGIKRPNLLHVQAIAKACGCEFVVGPRGFRVA